jgi:hypothetical protein
LRYATEKLADLSPALGLPGGSCHVIERIEEQVRNPRNREKLISLIEQGHPHTELKKKDIATIYRIPLVEGRVRGSKFKWVVINEHSQYRMDLRGVNLGDVFALLRKFHDAFTQAKQDKSYQYLDWERAIIRGREIEYISGGLVIRFVAAMTQNGEVGAEVRTVFWLGDSKPRPMSRGECQPFKGWSYEIKGEKPLDRSLRHDFEGRTATWLELETFPMRVARLHQERTAGANEWLKWIVQPFDVIWKHHKEFVYGPIDDAMDAIIKDLAPILVKEIGEEEVEEDVEEFLAGALKGKWDATREYKADPTGPTEDWIEGYEWGYANPASVKKDLPSGVKRKVVEEAVKDFRHKITENVMERALHKAWSAVSPSHTLKAIMVAVKKHGWKLGVAFALFEIVEHMILPVVLVSLTGHEELAITGTIPIGEIIYAIIFRIMGRVPADANKADEDGHLDWYEDKFGPVRIGSPMGDCYEANGRWFSDHALFPGKDKKLRIVHGEVRGQASLEGVQYGHCWIEDGSTVLDFSNGRTVRIPKAVYYEIGGIDQIDNAHTYTPEQFRRKLLDNEHWGPWDLKTSTGL